MQLDKQGRIPLNQNIINFAGLSKKALIIGMVNKIEIWDPSALNAIEKNLKKLTHQALTIYPIK